MSNRRRRRSLALLLVGAIGVGGVSSATFTDVESTPSNRFTAGTLDLTASPRQQAWKVDNMAPGDVEYRAIAVGNAGTLPLDYAVSVTMDSEADGQVDTNPDSEANDGLGEVLRLRYHGAVANSADCSAGAPGTSSVEGFLPAEERSIDMGGRRALAAGASEQLCFSFELPFTADNRYQGDSATYTLTFGGAQAGSISAGDTADGVAATVARIAISGTPRSGAVALSWRPVPGADHYSVVPMPRTGIPAPTTRSTTTATFDYTGLRNGVPLNFAVLAYDANGRVIGSGRGGPFTPQRTGTPPSAVQNLVVTGAEGGLHGTWEPATASAECPVTAYVVHLDPDDTRAVDRILPADATSIDFTEMSSNTPHTITVTATSECGPGAPMTSNSVYSIAPPGAVKNLSITRVGDGTLDVSYAAGTGTADSYDITATPVGAAPDASAPAVTNGSVQLGSAAVGGTPVTTRVTGTSATLRDLDRALRYRVTVVPNNRGGAGAPASSQETLALTTPATATVKATPQAGAVRLDLSSSGAGRSAASRYTITVVDASGHQVGQFLTSSASYTVTGLRAGEPYSLSITASNAAGDAEARVITSSPLTIPQAPTGVTAVPAPGGTVVSWTAPSAASVVESYQITATPEGGTPVVKAIAAPATTALVDGLTAGTRYSVVVTAVNGAGSAAADATSVTPSAATGGGSSGEPTSTPSASPTDTSGSGSGGGTAPVVVKRPGAVSNLTAAPSLTGAAISWTAPSADADHSAPTSYRVTVGASTQVVTTTSASFDNLVTGRPYTVTVAAVNSAGNSTEVTASVTPTPTSAPAAVQNLVAAPALGGVALSWNPVTGQEGVTYRVRVLDGAGTEVTNRVVSEASAEVNDLTPSQPYTASIYPINAAGQGGATTASFTAGANVAAPTGFAATSSALGTVDLNWNAVTGATGYRVSVSPAAGSASTPVETTQNNLALTGLDPATKYAITVTALNELGAGGSSSTTAVPTPLPAAPTGVTVSTGAGTATVNWSAGSAGGAVVRYVITGAGQPQTVSSNARSVTLTGLDSESPYSFIVAAENAGGSSAGAPTDVVYPAVIPTAPTAVTATANGLGSAVLNWAVPAGGTRVATYHVNGGTGARVDVKGDTTSATLTGLDPQRAYTFTVTAENRAGVGPAGSAAPVTPTTIPGAVTALGSSTAVDGTLDVSWTAPVATTSGAATSYVLRATREDGTGSPVTATVTAPETTSSLSGLNPAVAYRVEVTARNAAGSGPVAELRNVYAVATAGAPGAGGGVVDDGAIDLSWAAPSTGHVSGYRVEVTPSANVVGAAARTTTEPKLRFNGLANGTAYTFRIVSLNESGDGASTTVGPFTPTTDPGVVTNLTGIVSSGTVALGWTPPATPNTAVVTRYTVTTAAPDGTQLPPVSVAAPARSAVVGGLTIGQRYTFTVVASSRGGDGGSVSTTILAQNAPNQVTGLTAPSVAGVIQANWTASSLDSQHDGATSYDAVLSQNGVEVARRTVSSTSASFDNIPYGDYSLSVLATNGAGPAARATTIALTGAGGLAPSAVTALTATSAPGSGTVVGGWNAVTGGTGVEAVGGYEVRLLKGAAVAQTVTVTGTTANLTSLPLGDYTLEVRAKNAVRTGPATTVAVSVIAGLPGTPTGLQVTTYKRSAELRWTAPANDGGGPITSYTAIATPVGGGAPISATTGTSATSFVLSGLSAYTAYDFTIAATNSTGTGTATAAVRTTTSATTVFTPTATGPSGTLQRYAVTSAGSYHVEAWGAQGGARSSASYSDGGAGAYVAADVPLSAGGDLEVLVGQRGVAGGGYAGGGGGGSFVAGAAGRTPVLVAGGGAGPNGVYRGSDNTYNSFPSQPGQIGDPGAGGSGSLYVISGSGSGSGGGGFYGAASGDTASLVGSTGGGAYPGTGGYVPSARATDGTYVGAGGYGGGGYGYAAGSGGGGGYTGGIGGGGQNGGRLAGGGTSFTSAAATNVVKNNTDLARYGSGEVRVTFTDAVPNVVSNITTSTSAGSPTIGVSWTAAAINNQHDAATAYEVSLLQGATVLSTTTVGGASASITAPAAGAYTVSVVALNGVGRGQAATSAAIVTSAPPAAPTGVSGVANSNGIQLTWVAPSVTNLGAVTDYAVTYTPAGGTATTMRTGSATTSYALTGLTAGTTYAISVAAVNDAGAGTTSTSTSVLYLLPPGPATGVTAVATNSTVAVGWTAPTVTASSGAAASYAITLNGTGGSFSASATSTTTSFTNVPLGRYTASVTAVNTAGSSTAASAPVTVAGAYSAALSDGPMSLVPLADAAGTTAAVDLAASRTVALTAVNTGAAGPSAAVAGGAFTAASATTIDKSSGPAAGSFTIEGWAKRTAGETDAHLIYDNSNGGGGYALFLQNGRVYLRLQGATETYASIPGVVPNGWNHLAAVYDSSANTATLYVNGSTSTTLYANSSGGTITKLNGYSAPTGNGRIGSWGAGYGLVGGVAGVAVYDKQLSAARITAHYQAITAPTYTASLADAPLSLYGLNDATGARLSNEATGRNRAMSAVGTVGFGATGPGTSTAATFSGGAAGYLTASGTAGEPTTSNSAFTAETWIRPAVDGNSAADIDSFFRGYSNGSGTASYDGYGLGTWNNNGVNFMVVNAGKGGGYTFGNVLTPGVWQHVAVVYDGNKTATIYVNGVNKGTATMGAWWNGWSGGWTVPSNPVTNIGRFPQENGTGTNQYYKGDIAGAATYAGQLSAAQIAAHATAK